ncbi:hypothetical protein ACB098_02G082300 [Castanea mollissima]
MELRVAKMKKAEGFIGSFFNYNSSLGPPYRVLVDTNFINLSIQNKPDLEKGMMDCRYAKFMPIGFSSNEGKTYPIRKDRAKNG